MTAEIFIENQRLDLTEEISSLLTFTIDDIKDFSSRNTTFSKTIVLPGTANNNKLFGHIFDARVSNPYDGNTDNVSTNFNASVSADCLMFQSRVQTFKGTLRLLEIIIDKGVPEYEVAVFGELGGLIAKMGNKKLEDLDFSAYDRVWNVSGVTNSWTATPGTGLLFPLIDYGTVSAPNDKLNYDIRAFRPALYVREYIDKIITGAGYRWESALMDTTRFKRLVIPYNRKELQSISRIQAKGSQSGYQLILENGVASSATIPQSVTSGTDFTYSAGVWTYNGSDTKVFTINVSATGAVTVPGVGYPISIYIRRNGVNMAGLANFYSSNPNYQFDLSYDLTLSNGDTVDVYAIYTDPLNPPWFLSTTSFVLQILSLVPTLSNAVPGETIKINETTPRNILQKDFLSSIVKLFNLYIYESNFDAKKLFIKPYVDFYDINVSGVTDWSPKLDRTKTIRLKPMSELNSRYYNFKFKRDNDHYAELYRNRYSEGYGDRIYDSGFEFTNEKTDIELIFSASVLVGYQGKDKIVTALYKKSAGAEETMDTNIRVLQSMNVTGVTSWAIKDGTTTLQSGLTNYGYAGHYDDPDAPANDIHFGVPKELFYVLASGAINVHQFNVYWSSYMAEITDKDSKLMTAWLKLDAKDIFSLDFSKLKHIDGSIWRLNKIEDWNATEPDVCKAELLKVINLVY